MFISTNSFAEQPKEINTFVHPLIHIFTYAICLSLPQDKTTHPFVQYLTVL